MHLNELGLGRIKLSSFPKRFQSLRSALPLELKTHNHNYLANELMTLIEGCTVQFLERYKNN